MTTEHLKALEHLMVTLAIITTAGFGLLMAAIIFVGLAIDIVKELRRGKR